MDQYSMIESYKKIMVPFTKKLEDKHPNIEFIWDGDNPKGHIANRAIKCVRDNDFKHIDFG